MLRRRIRIRVTDELRAKWRDVIDISAAREEPGSVAIRIRRAQFDHCAIEVPGGDIAELIALLEDARDEAQRLLDRYVDANADEEGRIRN